MRVAVLPREVAAGVITGSMARSAWALNAANLALTIPLLIDFLVMKDAAAALPLPLAILGVMLALAVLGAWRPRPAVVVTFLVVGAVGAILYQLALMAAYPAIVEMGYFLLNRPAVSLVLVGVGAASWVAGVAWTMVGFLVSMVVSVGVAVVAGEPFRAGWAPLLMLGMYFLAYLVLGGIQASQRREIPDFDELERETRLLSAEEDLRSKVTAAVHDTLLNDLSIVMTAPDRLDERMTARLREDIETLTSTDWLTESATVTVVDDQDGQLRNDIMKIMSDLQWRGLTVHVTGGGPGIYRLEPAAATALLEAIRACLENVLRHSGSTVAEVDLAYTSDAITVVVSDQGSGFDPDAVPEDRLGLRQAVLGRMRSVNGSARIWSTPGAGTSIVMRVPVIEVVIDNEEPADGRS